MCLQQFRAFPLPGLLPAQHRLVVNTSSYVLSTFILTELSPEGVVAQQVVTAHEMYALVALLEAYPDYCPYEVLLAAITDETIDQARQELHQAIAHKRLDQELKPLRKLISLCRAKLSPFHLSICSVHEMGYMIVAKRSVSRSCRELGAFVPASSTRFSHR
jgi:hypothetical protein